MPIRIPGQAGDPDFLLPCAPALYFPRRVWYNNNSRKYEGGRRDVQPYLSGNYELLQSLVCLLPRDAAGAADAPAEEFRLLAGKLRPWTDYLYLHVLGEPLLHPQLAEILASAGELGLSRLSGDERDAARAATRYAAGRPGAPQAQRLAPQLRGQRRAHAAGDVSRRGLGRLRAARGARRALRAAALERGRAG